MNPDVAIVAPPPHSQEGATSDVTTITAYFLPEEFIIPRSYSYNYDTKGPLANGAVSPGRGIDGRLEVSVAFLVYLSPVVLAVCSVGNVLGAVIVQRFYPHVLSTAFYVFVVLVLDLLVVWSRCGVEWLGLVADVDLRDKVTLSSGFLCKVYPFLVNLVLHLDSWMLVAMAAETVFVYQRPQRLMRVCCLRRSVIVAGVLFASLCLLDAQYFWTYAHVTPFPHHDDDDDITDRDDDDDDDVNDALVTSPVCVNWIVQSARGGATGSGFDFRRMLVMIVDLVVTDLGPFFVVFSCCVMLLTKRIKRRDQVRQIDNTWKVCNVDSTTAHQLHTCFILFGVLHTILLFPKVTYKSFLFVTDLHQGSLQHPPPLGQRSSAVIARTVCFTLQYVYMSSKLIVFLIACPSFRRECRRWPTNCRDQLKPCSAPEDVGVGGHHVTSGDHVTTGVPLLPPPPPQNHVTDGECGGQEAMGEGKCCDESPSAILENGGKASIKIFSMTSV